METEKFGKSEIGELHDFFGKWYTFSFGIFKL